LRELGGTGLGLVISTVWAAALGQTMVASIFGLFAGFWLSFAILLLGLFHNWFLIPASTVNKSVALFLISWSIVFVALTLATVRLPVSYTAVVALVVLALVLWTIGGALTVTVAGSTITIPGFLVIAAVLYAGVASGAIMVIGRSFVQVSEDKNQAEAEYRYALTRLRENGESIAVLGGEKEERAGIDGALAAVLRKHPGLALSAEEGVVRRVERRLADGKLDVGLAYAPARLPAADGVAQARCVEGLYAAAGA